MKKIIIVVITFFFFCIGLYAQPANDDPCSAFTIPVQPVDLLGYNCVPATIYSWNNATLTAATPNPSCGVSNPANIRDVWLKLEVPSSGRIQLSILSNEINHLSLYSASSCSNTIGFVERACFTNSSINVVNTTTFTDLTAGTTMYLRIMRPTVIALSSGTIQLCLRESEPIPAIDNTTRVGIGTNNPLAKLDVVGMAIIRDSLLVNGNIRATGNLKAMGLNGQIANVGAVYSSPWLSILSDQRDTTIDGTCYKVRHLEAPLLTSEILNSKLITVYFGVGSIGDYQLPYISDAGGATNQINCFFKPGLIFFYRHTFKSCRFTAASPPQYTGEPVMVNLSPSLAFRYVIHN